MPMKKLGRKNIVLNSTKKVPFSRNCSFIKFLSLTNLSQSCVFFATANKWFEAINWRSFNISPKQKTDDFWNYFQQNAKWFSIWLEEISRTVSFEFVCRTYPETLTQERKVGFCISGSFSLKVYKLQVRRRRRWQDEKFQIDKHLRSRLISHVCFCKKRLTNFFSVSNQDKKELFCVFFLSCHGNLLFSQTCSKSKKRILHGNCWKKLTFPDLFVRKDWVSDKFETFLLCLLKSGRLNNTY